MVGEFDRLVEKLARAAVYAYEMDLAMFTEERLWGAPYGPHLGMVRPNVKLRGILPQVYVDPMAPLDVLYLVRHEALPPWATWAGP